MLNEAIIIINKISKLISDEHHDDTDDAAIVVYISFFNNENMIPKMEVILCTVKKLRLHDDGNF